MSVPSIEELKRLTDYELTERHGEVAKTTVAGINQYLEELRARQMQTYAVKMDRLTAGIFWITLVVTIATCINIAVFVWEKLP